MKKVIAFAFVFGLLILLAACNLPGFGKSDSDVSSMVSETLNALTPQDSGGSTAGTQMAGTDTGLNSNQNPSLTAFITPSITQNPSITPNPSATPKPNPGSISGSIQGYPYGSLPALTIVAFHQGSSYHWYTITAYGQTYYSLDDIVYPPGSYLVVAYDNAGHRGGCPGLVTVVSDQMATCNISDWSSAFPDKPAGVP